MRCLQLCILPVLQHHVFSLSLFYYHVAGAFGVLGKDGKVRVSSRRKEGKEKRI